MNNLENELNNFNGTSINSINKEDKYDRDLFKDVNSASTCKECDDKNINVSSFVKDLENKLDNFDNLDLDSGPMPSNVNVDFKENMKNKAAKEVVEVEEYVEKKPKKIDWNKKIYERLIKLKEPIVIIFLFILLNNEEFILMCNNIPYINMFNSPYPSLILRGTIMALLIYNLKKYSK